MPESLASVFAPVPEAKTGGPLYMRVSRRIEDAISRGVINPGDALPSERDIAEMSGISRVTVCWCSGTDRALSCARRWSALSSPCHN